MELSEMTGDRTAPKGPAAVGTALMLSAAVAAAAIVRFALALHSNFQIRGEFISPPAAEILGADKHSVVYPAFRWMLSLAGADPASGLFDFNAAIGSLAVVPFCLFALRRTGDLNTALFAALFFAVHPVLARFAPTDSPYSLLLFFWFSGLAALSAEPLPGWRAAAGILFLGIAATVRIDGPVYALASVPLLGAGALGRIAGRPRAAAAGLAAALALLGIQAAFKFSAWRGEFLEYAGSGPWPEAAAGFLLGALRRIWSAGDYARWTGRIVAAFFYAGIAVGIVRPGGRWTLWALAVMLLLEQFCYGSGGPTTPLLLHRSIPAFAVQCLICGAAAGWLARIASGFQWGRAAAVLLAAVITAAVPAANAGFLSREFAFNSEFRLVNAARADAAEGNLKCPLVFVRSNTDLGFPNPETLLPGWTVFPCDENEITPAECVREASDQDCAYYLRTGACFRNAGSGAWWPPNRYCAEVESRLKLEKILEIPADMHQSYGESETVQRRALLGLYHLTVDVK